MSQVRSILDTIGRTPLVAHPLGAVDHGAVQVVRDLAAANALDGIGPVGPELSGLDPVSEARADRIGEYDLYAGELGFEVAAHPTDCSAGAGASAVYTVPGDTRTPSIRAASYASSGSIVRGNPSHITTPRSGRRHSTSGGTYSRSAAANTSRCSR